MSIPRRRRSTGGYHLLQAGARRYRLSKLPRNVSRGGVLPFKLRRQSMPGPARERVGLVVADVRYRRVVVDLALPAERELCLQRLVPVQGSIPAAAD